MHLKNDTYIFYYSDTNILFCSNLYILAVSPVDGNIAYSI